MGMCENLPSFLLPSGDYLKNNPEKLKEKLVLFEGYVDFIIKLDNPEAFFSSWAMVGDLVTMSQLAGRYDLVKKGLNLLKEYSEMGKFTGFSNWFMLFKEAPVLKSDPIMQRMMDQVMGGQGRVAGGQPREPPSSIETPQHLARALEMLASNPVLVEQLRRQMQVMILIMIIMIIIMIMIMMTVQGGPRGKPK